MGESILTKPFLTSIGVEGLCIGIMTMTAFMIGYHDGNAVLASTMAFGTLCSSRLVHGFNCKANKPIIFTKRFWNNIYLIGAFVLGWLLITGVLMIPGASGNVQSADTDGGTVDDCIWTGSFESAGYSAAEMDQNAKEIEDLTGY